MDKTVLCIISSFFISFSLFYSSLYLVDNAINNDKKEFFKTQNDKTEKIFLIGSSHIGSINATFVHAYLEENSKNYDVYNLVTTADKPQNRLKDVDALITGNPRLVVYGLSYRDFESQIPRNAGIEKLLPDFSLLLPNLFNNIDSKYDVGFLEQPKFATLLAIEYIENKIKHRFFNTPELTIFLSPNTEIQIIEKDYLPKSKQELENYLIAHPLTFNGISGPDANSNLDALNEIITKLQQNDIQVIIFATPQSKIYLDTIPENDKIVFKTILESIQKDHNIKVYDLTEKYADLPIWRNPTHVGIGNNVTIYSKDIADIILREIEP